MLKALFCGILFSNFCAAALAQDLSTLKPEWNPDSAPVSADSQLSKNKDAGTFNRVILNFGVHTEFYNNIQNDSAGGVRKFDFAPTIGTGFFYQIDENFSFLPELNWVLPRSVDDSRIVKNLFMFRADFGYGPVDWFRLRFGTSVIWLNQHGRGGSTEVNNGNSTSTFYYPDENRSSFNNTLDLGAEVLFGDWALRLQTYTYAPFREERRQVSYTGFITYYWDL